MSEAATRDMEDAWPTGQMVECRAVWRHAGDWARFGTVVRDPDAASD